MSVSVSKFTFPSDFYLFCMVRCVAQFGVCSKILSQCEYQKMKILCHSQRAQARIEYFFFFSHNHSFCDTVECFGFSLSYLLALYVRFVSFCYFPLPSHSDFYYCYLLCLTMWITIYFRDIFCTCVCVRVSFAFRSLFDEGKIPNKYKYKTRKQNSSIFRFVC